MAEYVDVSKIVTTETRTVVDPSDIGLWMAGLASDVQAVILAEFCHAMKAMNPLAWRMQCAYIREDLRDVPSDPGECPRRAGRTDRGHIMIDTDDDTGTWFAEIVTLAALVAFVGLVVYGLWWWTKS